MKTNKLVKCNDCSCMLDKDTANRVKRLTTRGEKVGYYCHEHKKDYDRVVWDDLYDIYYKEVECWEDGTPVGYCKENEKDEVDDNFGWFWLAFGVVSIIIWLLLLPSFLVWLFI